VLLPVVVSDRTTIYGRLTIFPNCSWITAFCAYSSIRKCNEKLRDVIKFVLTKGAL
jgi:hypothetical protein